MKITVGEAASLFGVPDQQVRDWIEDQSLPAQQIRGEYRINRTELLEWATERRIAISHDAFRVEELTPSLTEALRAGGIHERVPSESVAAALSHIVSLLPLADECDRETLMDVLLARGSIGMTPVGGGIAIPHVRTPIILSQAGAVVSLSFLSSPVDLHAPDGLSIDTFFFLVSPTVHVHLAMLAKIAHALRDGTFRDAVRRRVASGILEAARRIEGAP